MQCSYYLISFAVRCEMRKLQTKWFLSRLKVKFSRVTSSAFDSIPNIPNLKNTTVVGLTTYISTLYMHQASHLCGPQHQTSQKLWLQHLTILQHINISGKKESHLEKKQAENSSFPFADSVGCMNILELSVPPSHLRRPPSSPILITNRKTKRQLLPCMMRPVFGGSTKIVLASEKSAGNKDLPVVFVYAAHLPIKMQMRNGLQMRLSKQMNRGKSRKE